MLRVRAILIGGVLACGLTWPGAHAFAAELVDRVIVYVDADNPRVKTSISKLQAALERSGVTSRHRTIVQHLAVDLWRRDDIARKLAIAIAGRPAIIVATNSENASIAGTLTRDVPIIFGSHQDPVRLGLVRSFAKPGGNLTGFTFFVPVDEKRLELLRQLAPNARRVGVVVDRWWMDESGGAQILRKARESFGFDPHVFRAESIAELRRELARPEARAMDAWYVPSTALPFDDPAEVLAAMELLKKPTMFPATYFAQHGGLVSYQPVLSLEEAIQLLATMIGLVLDGMRPADIPVERPQAFELSINLQAARRLGLQVPDPLLKRVDRVFMQPSLAAREGS
jgi:putative ABC transport system substrate-binding protein